MRILAAITLAGLMAAAQGAEPPKVVFAGFTLINTSLEPTSAAEKARLAMIDAELRDELDTSGRCGCQLAWASRRAPSW